MSASAAVAARAGRARGWAPTLVTLLALLLAARAHADEIEPPLEADDGEDYEAERADSLSGADLEFGVGLAGHDRSAASRRRHVRFESDSLRGSLRDGDDVLSGGSLEGNLARGRFGVGRVRPRWGRGLLLGDPADPWARSGAARYVRRGSHDLVWYRAGSGVWRTGILAGRLGARPGAAFEAGRGAVHVGAIGGSPGLVGGSAWWARDDVAAELALDRARRWRAEAMLASRIHSGRVLGWARGGTTGFAPPAGRVNGGPAQALAVAAELSPGRPKTLRLTLLASTWRFRPAVAGSRATLEAERALPRHGALNAGFEEQRGIRRDPVLAGSASGGSDSRFRQGLWGEWRAVEGDLTLGLRHEGWGNLTRARHTVRSVTTARLEGTAPGRIGIRVTQWVFRNRRGEHLYVPESGADRLVLRSLAGDGERTRVELLLPFGGGIVQAAASRTVTTTRAPRVLWTLDWTRRARLSRGSQ